MLIHQCPKHFDPAQKLFGTFRKVESKQDHKDFIFSGQNLSKLSIFQKEDDLGSSNFLGFVCKFPWVISLGSASCRKSVFPPRFSQNRTNRKPSKIKVRLQLSFRLISKEIHYHFYMSSLIQTNLHCCVCLL